MPRRQYYIYIVTNKYRNVLYTGVTNSLVRRISEHKNKRNKGFTYRYNVDILVYFETFDRIRDAIAREKQIKAGSRRRKVKLINSMNLDWTDLYDTLT